VQALAVQFDIAIQRAERERVAALATAWFAAGRAASTATRPCFSLSQNRSGLDGRQHCFAFGDREAKVFQALGRLFKGGHFLGWADGAVIAGDLEQDADTHGRPPMPGEAGELSIMTGVESSRSVRHADPGQFCSK
jgi:hypothetical protein